MTVTPITSDQQFATIASTVDPSTLVVIYFHTLWAAPCAQMSSVFQSLSDAHSSESNQVLDTDENINAILKANPPPAAVFLSVNADDIPDLSETFDVSAVPYFVLIRDATILKELSGADPKELANTIQSLINTKPTNTSSSAAEKQSANASSNTASQESGSTASPAKPTQTASEEEHEETEEELNARLSKLINAAPVMLFMKGTPAAPACGFSRQMVALLREHQVRFGFFDILKDNSVRQGLKAFSDWPTYPQLYINGELQGGLDIIKESLADDPNFFENAVGQASESSAEQTA